GLFLCAGAIIHALHHAGDDFDAQDMRLMGGLRKYMPITAGAFFIGNLAICGIPPFAGFWSKDEILGQAFEANPALWVVGWATAGLTAFYMFRMYFMTFEGEFRGNNQQIKQQLMGEAGLAFGPGAMGVDESHSHGHNKSPHESPLTMALPLLVLAVPSTLIGLLGRPWNNYFEEFIHAPGEIIEAHAFDKSEFITMAGLSVAIAVTGIIVAILMYRTKTIDPSSIAKKVPTLYRFSLNKWYLDDLFNKVFVIGIRRIARQIMEVDYRVVDGAVNLTGLAAVLSGEGLKYLENGRAQFYALIVFGAVLGFVLVFSVA
ncbi:MAG: dehydrogenase subunit 5, partial [Cyanobacteriota bacterium]